MRPNPLSEVLNHQRRWASLAGVAVDEKGYVQTVENNLQRPLSASALKAFTVGKGSELRDSDRAPAKMRALRSSSALCVNVFDQWSSTDCGSILAALGVDDTAVSIRFEAQYPTKVSLANPINPPPHLDIAIRLRSGVDVGIESKFTEWLSYRQREDRKTAEKQSFPKYLADGKRLWSDQGLPRCQALVESIHSGVEHFSYLNAPQLLKHALGLGTQCGKEFSLLYLFYNWPCAQAATHSEEIARFASVVGQEIRFRALTYQALFERLCKESAHVDGGYLQYLRQRYFAAA
ncbi:PGN_0703 family putative restriction endonuclease [Ralstonia pickettii]|uniref:PGN_0703 family putative restriction endonuclease n=1 Tax=Ralstonia pickettii TaxID=329 RepID=UPI0015C0486D|nr:hypothetical protein [Ralstonia pickettii]NWK43345.1 hypothetical protein [Ralstonia pickettii]